MNVRVNIISIWNKLAVFMQGILAKITLLPKTSKIFAASFSGKARETWADSKITLGSLLTNAYL